MEECDESGVGLDCVFDIFGMYESGDGVTGDACLCDEILGDESVVGSEDRVVVEFSGDDVVAGLNNAFDCDVKCIGAVECEDDVVGVLSVDEVVESFATLLEELAGLYGFGVRASAGGGAELSGVMDQRFLNLCGFGEGGGSVVHVNSIGGLVHVVR